MPFTLTDDLQFYGIEMSLSNILMIGLFRLNNRMIIFSKREKFISQQTLKVPYIYYVHMEKGRGIVLKFVTCLQILLFLNKRSIVHFWGMEGVGEGHKNGHFFGCHKCVMAPKWFKITTN